ncbi:hypothetical protein AC3_A0628 [Clostridium perfringens E str. JGS1987]|uniref:Uncharacterized protein n=1 Tax=Clostridium perfringens E str. JGS1987 TaxID=451755 RepID=B1BYG3_CLOPF|nr:hypothetical protein AC3_A0628 [Clostridium perfringens E str. JGS1987]
MVQYFDNVDNFKIKGVSKMNNINSCQEIIYLISEIIINYITRECVKEENN